MTLAQAMALEAFIALHICPPILIFGMAFFMYHRHEEKLKEQREYEAERVDRQQSFQKLRKLLEEAIENARQGT